MTGIECFDVLTYMCKKVGIDTTTIAKFRKDGYMLADFYGKIDNYTLSIQCDFITNANEHEPIPPFHVFAQPYTGGHIFLAYNARGYDVLYWFVHFIKTFKIKDINLCVTNPFFGLTSVVNCETYEEAAVICDLHFPGSMSFEISQKIQLIEQRKHKK